MGKTGENMWYDVCTTIQWNKSRYPKLFISTYVGTYIVLIKFYEVQLTISIKRNRKYHAFAVEISSENVDQKAVTYLIFFIGTH